MLGKCSTNDLHPLPPDPNCTYSWSKGRHSRCPQHEVAEPSLLTDQYHANHFFYGETSGIYSLHYSGPQSSLLQPRQISTPHGQQLPIPLHSLEAAGSHTLLFTWEFNCFRLCSVPSLFHLAVSSGLIHAVTKGRILPWLKAE